MKNEDQLLYTPGLWRNESLHYNDTLCGFILGVKRLGDVSMAADDEQSLCFPAAAAARRPASATAADQPGGASRLGGGLGAVHP